MIKLRPLAIGLGLAMMAASCTSSHHVAGPGATTSTTGADSTTEPTASGTPIVAPSTSSTSSTTAATGPALCATSDLTGTLTGANGAAGSVYYMLVLTNRGAATCILQGFPGVSFVTGASGAQVGAPATRISGSAPDVIVAPGGSGRAVLQITVASNYGSGCRQTTVSGLRVYPPNETAALFVPHTDQACANTSDGTLHVGAFQQG